MKKNALFASALAVTAVILLPAAANAAARANPVAPAIAVVESGNSTAWD
ncbi:hypothetical protein ACQEUX_12020 [Micromonospora sp. CA-259024]